MSKYTTEIRYICEASAGLTESAGYSEINNIIQQAAPKIFDFDFPIFDEQYRMALQIKILRHYYTREICEETVALWKLRLEDKLNLIMPYYNKLYKSELLEFNPFYDVDITRDHIRKNNGESITEATGHSENTETGESNRNLSGEQNYTATGEVNSNETATTDKSGTNWKLYSDTPQGGIDGIANDNDGVINNTYLTNATKDTVSEDTTTEGTAHSTNKQTSNQTNKENDATTTTLKRSIDDENNSTNTITNLEDYIEHVKGKQGTQTYAKMLQEFRNTFLNIDKMVIEELSDLFFGLW